MYLLQVRSARQRVQKPGVMEGELEPDSTLWCYFCQLEVTRHVTDHFTTMVWGGLLEHMARLAGFISGRCIRGEPVSDVISAIERKVKK
jgi:hypothetical protein